MKYNQKEKRTEWKIKMPQSNIILDISRYQAGVDFALLKSVGQKYIVAKCASGAGYMDVKWKEHFEEGTANGMKVGAYFWVDPIYKDTAKQAQFFLDSVKPYDVPFIALDWEQWWGDWQLWSKMMRGEISADKVPKVSAEYQLKHFRQIYEYIVRNSTYNVIVYSATWFLNSYCPAGYGYLADKYTWWADYIFDSKDEVRTWEYLETIAPTNGFPKLPPYYPKDKVSMWQFSGDKFMAKGVYKNEPETTLSAMDLNIWVNKSMPIEQFDKSSGSIVIPKPPPTDILYYVAVQVNALNVRRTPAIIPGNVIRTIGKVTVPIYAEQNGFGRISPTASEWITLSPAYVIKVPQGFGTYYIVTASSLNIRAQGTVASPVIGILKKGEIIEVESISNGWGKLFRRPGYVNMYYTKRV